MAKLVEIYPKIGCTTDGDPTGFTWPAGIKLMTSLGKTQINEAE